jgi:hypothetical protein
MKRGKIDKLCEQINNARGVVYPQVGCLMYANIAGDGRRHRTVYQISNADGGVCPAHNSCSPRVTASNLRGVLVHLASRLTRSSTDNHQINNNPATEPGFFLPIVEVSAHITMGA